MKDYICTQLASSCFPCELEINVTVDNTLDIVCTTATSNDTTIVGSTVCAWWDPTSLDWRTEGCTMSQTTSDAVTCSCSHLTNFAVLVNVATQASAAEQEALSIVSSVGLALAITCLFSLVVIYAWLHRRKFFKVPQKIIFHLSLALLGFGKRERKKTKQKKTPRNDFLASQSKQKWTSCLSC